MRLKDRAKFREVEAWLRETGHISGVPGRWWRQAEKGRIVIYIKSTGSKFDRLGYWSIGQNHYGGSHRLGEGETFEGLKSRLEEIYSSQAA